jgi:hypothetical protein
MDLSNLNDIENHLSSLRRITSEEFESNLYLSKDEFHTINCGHFIVHLAAGIDSLSVPKSNVYDKINDYTNIQVFIEEKSPKISEMRFVNPGKDDRFQGFGWRKYFYYINYDGKTHPSYIGTQVAIKDILSLIKDCYKLSRLKIFF